MADKKGLYLALFEALKGSGGGSGVTDVQINGTSVVTDGVANVPVATNSEFGVVKGASTGIGVSNEGGLYIQIVTASLAKSGTSTTRVESPSGQHFAVYYGLAKAAGADMASLTGETVGIYPAAQKSAISTMLHAPETVTGTTPTITALAGVQYVCGEVATLDITLPASGCVDVRFESGSTPTVLTITPPTGVTVKWAGGFDPTALEANTVYEINIADGLGVAASWT